MGFIQYLKDTQAELRHVAWPTRAQTVVFTVLVALLSVLVAAYLGAFDYVFTLGLKNILGTLPAAFPTEAASSSPVVDVQISTSSPQ